MIEGCLIREKTFTVKNDGLTGGGGEISDKCLACVTITLLSSIFLANTYFAVYCWLFDNSVDIS